MITINELFSGIGAQVAALKRNGVKFKVVGISEIDKYAIKSYEAINGKTRNYGDISKVESLDYADLWTYSFPCTDISLAGKQMGLTDETGKQTRSGLLFEVERLLRKSIEDGTQPKYLLLENVKNLVGKKFKPEFDKWLLTLEELGYNNYWKVLNAKDYGVPQNRERVFVVSIRKDVDTQGYTFPEPFKLERRLKDVLETNVDEKYYLKQDLVKTFIKRLAKQEVSNTIRCGCAGSIDQKHTWDLVVGSTQKNAYKGSTDGSSPCLTAAMGMGWGQIPMIVNGGNKNFSQHTQDLVAEPSIVQNPHDYNNGGIIKDNVAPTMTSNGSYHLNNFVCNEPLIAASRGRNPDNPLSREAGLPTEQMLEINQSGCSNTLTTVGKDNLVVEPINACTDGTAPALTAHLHKETVNDCTKLDRHSPALGVIEIGIGHNPISKKFEFDGFHENKPCPTLLATDYKCPKCYSDGVRIRKLTPKECWRLMDFKDEEYEAAEKAGVSKTQLYKQAGNSIVVSVLAGIFNNLLGEQK